MTNKTYAEIKEIISKFQRTLPVDVIGIAKALKIEVHFEYGWSNNISGKILHKNDGLGYEIFINADHPAVRQRFTLAHELAHYILHKESIGDGITDDALYRSGLSNVQEIMANKLAADILMPLDFINQKLREGISSIEKLAQIFQVSQTAMAIRLGIPSNI